MTKKSRLFTAFCRLSLLAFCLLWGIKGYSQPACTNTFVYTFNPATGPEGTAVTLTGVGFSLGTGTSSVKFNGLEAVYTVVSDTQIVATVPTGSTTGSITVITNGCMATATGFVGMASSCTTAMPELYISELYDHVPGSYGVIELYNPSPTNTITFNDEYVLERYGSVGDATPTYTLVLPGSVGPESTFLVLTGDNSSGGCSVVTSAQLGAGINADDEFKLKRNGVVIDIAHAPGETGYSVIRKPNAVAPTTSYSDSDWNFYSTQSCADLGSHTADPVAVPPTISLQPVDATVCENAGTVTFTVGLSVNIAATYQWKTLNTSGAWVNATNGTSATFTVNVSAAVNNTQYYCVITTPDCTLISNAVQLTVNPLPSATFTVTNPTCTTTTGTITVNPVSGTGLTYSLDGGSYQTAATFTGVAVGDHTVSVKNAEGCILVLSPVTIAPVPTAPAAATATLIQPTCTLATGTLTITAPLGAEYQYSINGGAYQSSPIFTNLTANSYVVTVQNTAGCTSTSTAFVILPVPGAPAVATATLVQPTCTTATGTLTVTSPLGAEYQYSINGGAYQSSPVFANLTADSYVVTVQNTLGCSSVSSAFVISPAPATPAMATATLTQPDCTTATGMLTITAPLGSEYQYSINGGAYQNSPVFANLTADSYVVTVQNTAGCISTSAAFVISAAPAIPAVATATLTQPDCTTATGTLTVTAPLGAEYQYSINGGAYQASPVFTNLIADSYVVTVQNTAGCTSVSSAFVINPATGAPAIATATLIQPDCTTVTGTLTVTAPLGADYQYSLNGGAFQTSPVFANLSADSYVITVQNTAGCTSASTAFVINPAPVGPATATATVVQPDCTTATGSITITAPVGTGYLYSINGSPFQAGVVFANLSADSYVITVQDAAGCTSQSSQIVINTQPVAPAIATVTLIQPDCSNTAGTLTVTAPTGSGYLYSINGGAFQSNTSFTGLAVGNYTVTVQNADGCTSVSGVYTINAAQGGQPELAGTQGCTTTINGKEYLLEGTAANASFDPSDVTYEWTLLGETAVLGEDATFNVTQYVANNNLDTDAFPLQFELTVTTVGGCTDSYVFTVDGVFCDIPRGISPNNDQMNDNFDLTGLDVKKLTIVNRYGLEVYHKNNYTNQWNGQTDNGNELPTGTYFYVVETASGTRTGWVYINREVR
ncbi:gliding motility-associated C-terminal domain-containing protein [Flavobacterium sp. RHBU_3]|uniref:T9SS type B sorting domain-containing protein n=1 Tax=Flavobacterium sp. RHBU_3 TaxID=3391184 RepID=UPI003985198C